MQKSHWLAVLAAILLLCGGALSSAQTSPEPLLVELVAEDGVKLSGGYYASPNGSGPAVLLVHQLYTTRTSWQPLIQPLLDSGYHVLAVDVRGYGASKARLNWAQATTDSRQWAEWLASQSGVESVQVIGSSMGSALALNACAAYEGCKGAVALSPGLAYYGVSIADALESDFPKLFIYADRDRYPALLAKHLATSETVSAALEQQVFTGRAHGMDLFRTYPELKASIIAWLDAHK